ncbi:MAG: DUF3467 domain-containing protein [Candidatus Methylacidiphilales bacterium]|nr:DUF3467 domain-containing protein [Candidatus Methylacidiphilales bacterium]
MDDGKNKAAANNQVQLKVKYDDLSAKYASQVIINASAEEVFLDFSSGVLRDPNSSEGVLSVHTRIAMTPAAARRFLQALDQSLSRTTATHRASSSPGSGPSATLPRL